MNNFEDNQQKGPPPYETTVDSNTNVDGIPQTTEKYESYPPLSQPSNNPEHMPQTLPIVIGASVFGPRSCTMTCFNCNKAIVTETHTRAGLLAYTICGILLLFGFYFTVAGLVAA
ncbi:unnamed protein product [Acanthocheilonema viteae]|uniref:LITAF domain-containing protein n=1 Tax=Acanthocheilonema viteae TaxID=6277 RepID=A0A498SRP6_ACAVI|nr:unnamed protein product [Acanthocheilonema viteae]